MIPCRSNSLDAVLEHHNLLMLLMDAFTNTVPTFSTTFCCAPGFSKEGREALMNLGIRGHDSFMELKRNKEKTDERRQA